MLISRLFLSEDPPILSEEDYEDSPEHQELRERLRKTLYYGKNPISDRPSLPVTEIAVELLQEVAPRELGKVDEFVASSLSRKTCVSPCALMIGLIYIERLKNRNPEYLQQISSSDLFLISMMVASKYLYDEGVEEEVFNEEWSESANMEVGDLNELERNFLSAVDWNLFVKEADFRKVLTNIERRVAVRKGRERGFYSYCDLMVLSENKELQLLIREIMLQLCKVVLVCSVAYVASVLTLLGSSVSLGVIRQHSAAIPVFLGAPSVFDLASVDHQFGLDISPFVDEVRLADLHKSLNTILDTDDLSNSTTESDAAISLQEDESAAGQSHANDQRTAQRKTKTDNDDLSRFEKTHKKTGLNAQPKVTFPNFLTLSVIRDTVVQFLLAFKDQRLDYIRLTTDDEHSTLRTDMNNNYVCSRGCCQGGVHPQCQNSTVNDRADPCWKISTSEDSATDWLPCSVQQCCCPSAANLGPWYKLTSEVNDPLREIQKGFQTMRLIDAVS